MRRNHRIQELEGRVERLTQLVDKVDRSVERIELVTVVREPNTSISADAYNGLRKQVIAAAGERNAHLLQLVQFDSALRSGATPEALTTLVGEWLEQAAIVAVDDPAHEDAFDVVGPAEAALRRVVRPAYVDRVTSRVVRSGVVERYDGADEPETEPAAPAEEEPMTVTGGQQ